MIDSCCNYEVTATSGGQSSQPQRFTVRVPKHLGKGAIAHLYNQSLVDEGYYTGGHVSGKYNHGSQLATLAFRKVNNMAPELPVQAGHLREAAAGRRAPSSRATTRATTSRWTSPAR